MRCSILLLLIGGVIPAVALASAPIGPNSTVPSCISLVGSSEGVPATAMGQFQVVVRDIANNTVSGAVVTVDLSSCPDVHLCADQLDPGLTVNCGFKQVSKPSDATGTAQFTLLGGSTGAGNAVGLLLTGRVSVSGTTIGFATVCVYDLDGSGGVGAGDLSAWLTDFGSGNTYGRSDYDCNGSVGAGDLSLWLTAFGSGTMAQSCASQCP